MRTDKQKIIDYPPRAFNDRTLSPEEILEWFDVLDAGWMHSGNPKDPHAELSYGKCSNGFFDCMRVLCYPNLRRILAHQLVRKLKDQGLTNDDVDWVIGSPYAAITFSGDVAYGFLKAIHGFTEKDPLIIPTDPKRKGMLWQRMTIPKGANVLQVEELITSSGTFKEVRRAVEKGNSDPVNFIPTVGVLVHRPSKLPADYGDRKVVALVEKEVWAVEPSECSLCKAGSKRLKPKANWEELTGKA